jgi:hypothetical protein
MSAAEGRGGSTGAEVFAATVEEARLKRDDEGSGLASLVWTLRRAEPGAEGERVIRFSQVFTPETLPAIRKNLAMCGVVAPMGEVAAHLVRAAGCELELRREGERIEFVRRLDSNVFAGDVEPQRVAEEIPL